MNTTGIAGPKGTRALVEAKTYLVTFSVRDCYRITLDAASRRDAIEKAQGLYGEEHEAAFEFDLNHGGTEDWDAEAVQS